MPATPSQRLFRVEVGSGSPVLVLHGGLGWDHTYLRPGLDPLGTIARVIYFDQLGNGASPAPPDWSVVSHDTWVEATDGVRERLGLERVILFGHSYGAFLALEYALQFPHHVAGLIVCAGIPDVSGMGDAMARAAEAGPAAAHEALVSGLSAPIGGDDELARLVRAILPLYFAHEPTTAAEDALLGQRFRADAHNRAMFHCLGTYDVTRRLPQIQAPTLLLAGRHDWLAPPLEAERMLRELPDAQLHVFENSGHFPFLEEPAAFRAVVSDWIAGRAELAETGSTSGREQA